MRLLSTAVRSFYQVETGVPAIDVFISTTPASRRLLSTSSLVGAAFQSRLASAVRTTLDRWLRHDRLANGGLPPSDGLYLLRGGLSFAPHTAPEGMTGGACPGSFMSSERSVRDGAAVVTSDGYRKFDLRDSKGVVIGDILATGRTVINAIRHVVDDLGDSSPPERFVIVGVGTDAALTEIARLAP